MPPQVAKSNCAYVQARGLTLLSLKAYERLDEVRVRRPGARATPALRPTVPLHCALHCAAVVTAMLWRRRQRRAVRRRYNLRGDG